MQGSIKIHGLREIQDSMLELPKRMDVKLLNKGLIEGAVLVRDEARARVPLLRTPVPHRIRGTIQRAIRAGRVRPMEYTATVWVRVRPLTKSQHGKFKAKQGKSGLKQSNAVNPRDPYYWFYVEFGTSKMAATPFLRPAFESRKVAAVNKAVDTWRPMVAAEIMKLNRLQRFRNKVLA